MRFIVFNILILLLVNPVSANNDFTVSNKTFFTNNTFDRIYFDPKGTFKQQLENNFGDITAGDSLNGTWQFSANNQELCMDYIQPKLNTICLDVLKNIDIRGYSVFGKAGKRHFIWKDFRDGNWLLSQSGMAYLKQIFANKPTNPNIDNDIIKYRSGKILDGFGGVLSHAKNDGTGQFRDRKTQIITPYTWTVKNGYTISYVDNKSPHDVIITLGQEFLNKREPIAVSYNKKSSFKIEGENFKLINYNDHPKREIFKR